ncbi:mechanosensitive ion channel family protein [Kordiimonas gwangyangensis]|uniref:mechanosensitive ion channel family protein n=2 Tax=Kordiimonas gwangyangensis TaxID=288022 RepID=UPI000366FBB7|nr:mechanosensitive ion channel domain-containing protein [Kordiimonas gwangyangensis]
MEEELQAKLLAFGNEVWVWLQANLLAPLRLIELGIVIVAYFASRFACSKILKGLLKAFGDKPFIRKFSDRFLLSILSTAMTIMLVWTAMLIVEPLLGRPYILSIATSLFSAWLVIRLAVSIIANRELARLIAGIAWTLAALNIIGLLDPILTVLEGAHLPLGDSSVSVLDVFQGIVTFGVLLWAALAISSLMEKQIVNFSTLPPSARVLVTKSGKILLVSIAFLTALNATGIDLTALAVFGGALGVGIGFGLQKVVGNFISGIILLMDRSIKPGDVIETQGTYGTINRLAARYTSVITRDGTEFLIPNEDMITQPVINWSHSHRLVRRRIPVQVSYESDIRRAMELMVEAAGEESRVLSSPEPRTLLKNFGADGVDLELRMWIEDPQNGVSNIASDVMLHIWDKFHEEGIEFPYPQRVVHFKTDGPLPKIAVVPPNYEEGELETDEAILAEAEAGKAEKTDGENKAD